ncbi:UPF0481 protein At3g47200-like isoform X2 [Pyrus x bretschneideri]|uniref:UPF0481 protein At3g47200-like isoform X2 n=1 Tax=Pyrus x bretschneideri TaxID=225117 RepID=UPI00202E88F0|nr:UPF0481 protein At3g47200-like isoform X2 [Pyrus x bretschneideri]
MIEQEFVAPHIIIDIHYNHEHIKMELSNHDPLVTSMSEELDRLPPLSPSCCIYRVPKRLRRVSEKAYTPQVVSIGPLHHGKEALKAMEELKYRYLKDFLERTDVTLEYCIRRIRDKEAVLRSCYAETIKFTSDEFVRIILVDAAFIIEILMRFRYKKLRVPTDRIFNKPRMLEDVWPDMRMLENQLPFFILVDLFDQERNRVDTETTSIIDLSHHFFKNLMYLKDTEDALPQIRPPHEVEHFVDFVRKLYPLPPPSVLEVPQARGQSKTLAISSMRSSSFVVDVQQAQGPLETLLTLTPSMTQLYRAGVKFKVGSSRNKFDIRFEDGVLEIPKITISDQSEVTLTNLLVYEQSLCQKVENYINDYVVILNILVKTPEDVELLVKNGIVENKLGDSSKGCTMIKNLADGVVMDSEEFYFATLCDDLTKYYKMFRHRGMEYLIKHFFNSPWTTKEIIAAVILLVLTLIQTVCSVISATQKQ